MITIKLKYKTTDENMLVIQKYIHQYTSLYHCVYNFKFNDNNDSHTKQYVKTLNNIDLVQDAWFVQSCLYDIKPLLSKEDKIIFGGKSNFIKRCKNKISKQQYKERRLQPLCSIGDANTHANRKFQINEDLNSVTFKPNRNIKINLEFVGIGNRLDIIKKLYVHQLNSDKPITYKLDLNYVYISFEEDKIKELKKEISKISNRILGIDLNPNYIGWSIVDWKSENEFKIIKSGIYKFKDLNDKEKTFKKLKLSSESKERKYLNNKRKHEILEVAKNIINKALYYKVESVVIEDLNIKSKDSGKGKKYNKQVNNQWIRNDFVNNLNKRCNIFKIRLQKVKAEYSSFIGNFVFRHLNLPDPILASIELGRRGYEFINQYITKKKEIKKNIIWLDSDLFNNWIAKSLEEFSLKEMNLNLFEIYCLFKNSKIRYRVPITSVEGQVLDYFSKYSKVKTIEYFI